MEDRSFWYLTQDKVIDKINIDSRLVESFKRVMIKLQNYFNANGYTRERDYQEFFKQYLFGDKEIQLKILVSDEPSKTGASGFYRWGRDTIEIHVDESVLKSNPDTLDSVLCHEFIHFLVMRAIDKVKYPDPEILRGGFINEALTEMLNQQIYPNSKAYIPQVSMLKFANALTGNVNNYSMFLRGKVDAKGGASSWVNFTEHAYDYQKEWRDKGFFMDFAINDPNYIAAQRSIIEANIKTHLIANFDEYDRWLSIIDTRPAPDTEWINTFKNNMDIGFLNKLSITDPVMKAFLDSKLKEYRLLASKLAMYDGKDVIEFEIAGRTVAIDENRRVYNAKGIPYQISWSSNSNIVEFRSRNEIETIDMATADFTKLRTDIMKKMDEIRNIFSKTLSQDMRVLNENIDVNGLKRIERITLPNIEQTKSSICVYIAIYEDHIEILDNPINLGTIHNIRNSEYLGLTSKTDGAIYERPLGSIDSGIAFSTLREDRIDKSIQSFLYSKIKESITDEKLEEIITDYRNSIEYDLEDDINLYSIRSAAIGYYTRKLLANMSEEDKKELYVQVIENNPRYIISTKDGNLDVSLLFGKSSSFKGTREVLVDMNSNALFNDYFASIRASKNKISREYTTIELDDNGNIALDNNSKHQEILSQVQELLGFTIDNTDGFEYDRYLGVPRILLKNAHTLREEQIFIMKQLEEIYYDGELDYKTYMNMKKAVVKEYEKLIKTARIDKEEIEIPEPTGARKR